MPIYEYECQKCKTRSEVFQKISDQPLKKCRECGGRLEKLWSPTGFQFKGSGWYVTDYAGRKTEAQETVKETSDGKADKETKSAPADTAVSNGNVEAKKSEKKTEKAATPAKAKKD